MFQSSLDEASVANPPVSRACFTSSVRSSIARLYLLPHLPVVFLLIATMFMACEAGLVRQVHYYEKVGDFEAARQYLESELQRRPQNAEARYHLGKVLFKLEKYVDGRTAFEQVETQTARFSEPIQFALESGYRTKVNNGADAIVAEDLEAAVLQLTHATQIQPAYNAGHRLLGHALVKSGKLKEALPAYQQAISIDPDDFESWNNMSEIAFVHQDYEAVKSYANEATRIDPQHIPAIRRLAHAQLNLKENQQARLTFEQLLTLESTPQDVRDYAYFLFNTGDLEAAMPHLEELTDTGEPSLLLLKTLGEVYAGLNFYKKAISVNEQIISRIPDDRSAIGSLIAAHEKLGQFEQAKEWQAKLSRLGGEM